MNRRTLHQLRFSYSIREMTSHRRYYLVMSQNITHGAHQQKFSCTRVQETAVPEWKSVRATDALGRVYIVHLNNFECYFLRFLLYRVKSSTSCEALRTVNGQVCATFCEVYQIRRLLDDDVHWNPTMIEAVAAQSPARLRYPLPFC